MKHVQKYKILTDADKVLTSEDLLAMLKKAARLLYRASRIQGSCNQD